jgi:hypothetical protein
VLAIFLAGMSAAMRRSGGSRSGSSRADPRKRQQRACCARTGIVEASIGVFAWVFSALFRRGPIAPRPSLPESPPAIGFALDVALAALLIGPPTALMGATIPMLTQALSRSLADASRLHALVYSLNTWAPRWVRSLPDSR